VWLFLFFLNADHFTAFVMTAVGTDSVRQTHLTTIGALYQVARLQGIVGAATVAATGRMFSLWMRGHGLTPELFVP
jgi:hypothetical protein